MKKLFLMLLVALPIVAVAQKFGHVNQQEVFAQMPEMRRVQQQIDTLSGQYETQIANMQEEYRMKIADYQQNAQTMPEATRAIREQEIGEMEQRIQLFYQTAQQDVQKKQQELLTPLHEKLTKAIQDVGKEGNFTYIFDSMAMTYISDSATDVTPLVKAKLGIK